MGFHKIALYLFLFGVTGLVGTFIFVELAGNWFLRPGRRVLSNETAIDRDMQQGCGLVIFAVIAFFLCGFGSCYLWSITS